MIDWWQVPSGLTCKNIESLLFFKGSQFPISVSTLVINSGGVGVGGALVGGTSVGVGGTEVVVEGASVEGIGVAAGALHLTKNKRTTVMLIKLRKTSGNTYCTSLFEPNQFTHS